MAAYRGRTTLVNGRGPRHTASAHIHHRWRRKHGNERIAGARFVECVSSTRPVRERPPAVETQRAVKPRKPVTSRYLA